MIIKEKVKQLVWDCNRPFMAKRYYKKILGYPLDLSHPCDINEKIQWLLCYSDTSRWVELSDKYRVREYMKSCDLENLLVKMYGAWDNANNIDFNSLPDKFVLKCNHDSGSFMIVDKNTGFNKQNVVEYFNKCLKIKYGYRWGELFYNKIKPLIIAEEYLEETNSFSSSIVDYKVWCFDGNPYCIMTYYNREKDHVYINSYDLEWNGHPERLITTDHYRVGDGIPKPRSLNKMLQAASILSIGFPEVRVDFYEINGNLYFGEMTFANSAGYTNNYTQEFLLELGKQCVIPIR